MEEHIFSSVSGSDCLRLHGIVFFDVKTAFAEDDISMSFSSATISLDIAPGQFDSGHKDFSVSTTNSAGYTVTMSTVGPSSALTTTTVGNSSSIPTYTFPSGVDKMPANFIYSGDHNTNDDAGRGSYTRLWSSTASDANSTYRMGIQSNNVTPVRAWNKWTAFAVRCIAQT